MAVTDILTQIDVAPGLNNPLNNPVIDVPESPGRQRSDSQKQFARSLEQARRRNMGDRPRPSADKQAAPPSTSKNADAASHSERDRGSSETARPAKTSESSRTEKQPATDLAAKRAQDAEQSRSEANEADRNPPTVESESNGDGQIEQSPPPALATQITQTIAETLDLPEPPVSLPAFVSVEAAGESLDLTNENTQTPADSVPLPPPGLFRTLATQTTDSDVGEFAASDAAQEASQPSGALLPAGVGNRDAAANVLSNDAVASGDLEIVAPSSLLHASDAQTSSEAVAEGDVAPQEPSTPDPLATAVIADTVDLDAEPTVSAIPHFVKISESGDPEGPASGELRHVDAELESAGDGEIGSSGAFEISADANPGSNLAVQQGSTAAETIAALDRSSGTAAEKVVSDGPIETTTAASDGPQGKSAQSSTTVNSLDAAGAPKPAQKEAVVEVQPSVPQGAKPSPTIDRVSQAVRLAHVHGRPLRVRLHPPELGAVHVELVNRNGHLIARLDVQTTSAHRVILDNMGLLHDALAQQGTSIERVDVHLADNPDSDSLPDFSEPQEDSAQHDDAQQQRRREHNEETDGPDESAEQPAQSGPPAMDQLDIQV